MKRCDECGVETWESGDPYEGMGVPVVLGGQRHKSTCPMVQRFSQEQIDDLMDRLAEMDRVRRRGEAEARNYWLGGHSARWP